MVSIFILFVLPTIISANIYSERMKINFNFNFDPKLYDTTAKCSGADAKLISDIERQSFKVHVDNLKFGGKQMLGELCDAVYLRSPSVLSDLYKSHNWTEVHRILKPLHAEIVKISAEPTIVYKQVFENKGTEAAIYNIDMTHIVENYFISRWIQSPELTVNGDILHEFDIGFLNSGGYMTTSYTSPWGVNSEKKQKVNIGSASEFQVKIEPNGTMKTRLLLMKAHAQLEVNFLATLVGHVVFDYDSEYNGHRFWGFDIDSVMKEAGLETSVKSKEVLEIDLHTHTRIIIDNMKHPSEHMEKNYK